MAVKHDIDELRAEFRDAHFWKRHAKRFLAYALRCMARRSFRGSFANRPAGGTEADDFVTTAAILILDSTRRCPEGVSSVAFVLGVIQSLVSHSADSAENRTAHQFITTTGDDERAAEFDESRVVHAPHTDTEDELLARELAQEFMNGLPEYHRRYVKLLLSGLHPRAADRAKAMAVPVSEIRNLDKAIRRLRPKWRGIPPPKK